MKTLGLILLFGVPWLTAAAQTIIHIPPMALSRQELATPLAVKIWDGNAPFQKSPFRQAPASCYVPQEHYTAFFCKLEFLSMQGTRVWFKIHAGDYDSYSRKRW